MAQKKLRYYWWILLDFFKKNNKALLLSFIASLLVTIGIFLIAPYFGFITGHEKRVIGYRQIFDKDSLPPEILEKISTGLTTINPDGRVLPLLAESWDMATASSTVTVHLKKNLSWNNHTPFTSKDISLRFRNMDISRPDAYTLVFNLRDNQKFPATFPVYLNYPVIKPPLIGIGGDYTVSRIKTNNLGIYELYLMPLKKKLPYLVYKFYENKQKMIEAYKLGEITEFESGKDTALDELSTWNNTHVSSYQPYSQVVTAFLRLDDIAQEKNLTKEDIDELRHAITLAIPQDGFKQYGELVKSPIAPTSWAFNKNTGGYTYDKEKAKKLVEKYSPATQSASLSLYTSYSYVNEAEKVADALKEVGLSTSIQYIGFENPPSFDIMIGTLELPKDPDQYFFWHSTQFNGGNIAHYSNPRVDILLEEGRETLDAKRRASLYAKFQDVFMANPPVYFLYYPQRYLIQRK